MRKTSLFVAIVFVLTVACNGKKESVVVTDENITQVLTQYGKENPENEVVIETSFGKIKLRLYEDTPLHRANFIKLVKEGYYDNEAEFYRIVNEFVIQGGDINKSRNYTIPAEFNPKYYHKKGALAMARSDENNPEMRSSSTEFYIMHGSRYDPASIDDDAENEGLTLTPEQRKTYLTLGGDMSLDQRYTVFGEVVEGLDVVDKIASVKVYNIEKPVKKVPFKIFVTQQVK